MGSKKKVYCTRLIPKPGMDLMKANTDFSYHDSDEAITKDKLLKNVKGLDALLCLLTDPIDKEVLDAVGPQLKIVSTMSVGFEHIDLQECKKRKIICTHTPNVSTDSVSEFTVALLLFVMRRLGHGLEAVKKGDYTTWKPTALCGHSLHDAVAGVYGMGRIGFGTALRIKPFGVKKIIYSDVQKLSYADDIPAEFVDFDHLLTESDVIIICCNLTPQTKYKFNAESFKKMKKNAVIVNTGRGGVIQHDDLYQALKNNVIAGAGLDTTEPEPLPKDHQLVHLPNCVVCPHMGSNTWDTRDLMALTAANNILSIFKGEKALGEINYDAIH